MDMCHSETCQRRQAFYWCTRQAPVPSGYPCVADSHQRGLDHVCPLAIWRVGSRLAVVVVVSCWLVVCARISCNTYSAIVVCVTTCDCFYVWCGPPCRLAGGLAARPRIMMGARRAQAAKCLALPGEGGGGGEALRATDHGVPAMQECDCAAATGALGMRRMVACRTGTGTGCVSPFCHLKLCLCPSSNPSR